VLFRHAQAERCTSEFVLHALNIVHSVNLALPMSGATGRLWGKQEKSASNIYSSARQDGPRTTHLLVQRGEDLCAALARHSASFAFVTRSSWSALAPRASRALC
jgi:hypothetical protein